MQVNALSIVGKVLQVVFKRRQVGMRRDFGLNGVGNKRGPGVLYFFKKALGGCVRPIKLKVFQLGLVQNNQAILSVVVEFS